LTIWNLCLQALNRTFNCLPGQKDVDEAINEIEDSAQMIQPAYGAPQSGKSYSELQTELTTMAAHLNDASGDVVSTAKYPSQLAQTSKKFSSAHGDLLKVGSEMVAQNQVSVHCQKPMPESQHWIQFTTQILISGPCCSTSHVLCPEDGLCHVSKALVGSKGSCL
jgi:hypothetical protein